MTSESSKPRILPILAHVVLLIAAPMWFMITAFSFMIFTGDVGVQPVSITLFILYWAGPVVSVILLLALWLALYRKSYGRVRVLSWGLIAVQLLALIFLLASG